MKFYIFILFTFLTFVYSDILLQEEKNSIDTLIQIYNLNPIQNDSYCDSLPHIFICDKDKTTIDQIKLNGNFNNRPTLQDGLIDKFQNLTTLSIDNSIILNLFNEIIKLNSLSLNNCGMSTFQTLPQTVTSLSMHDVTFNGNIKTENLLFLYFFNLTYSSSDIMGDFIFEDVLEKNSTTFQSNFIITTNNIFKIQKFILSSLTIILGKYFNQTSFNNLNSIQPRTLIINQGYYNEPITFNGFGGINAIVYEFKNINFKYESDIFLNFTNQQLKFDNCSGLIDSKNDLKMILGQGVQFFFFINSKLSKLPSFFLSDIQMIDLSNNLIQGTLPPIYEPNDVDSTKSFILNGNQLSGSIPDNYCFHHLQIANNLMSGVLPMCFVCFLNDVYLRNKINGNNFNNYISGSTNNFPICSGIEFFGKTNLTLVTTMFVNGNLLGWNSPNPVYESQIIESSPSLSFSIIIPNKRASMLGTNFEFFQELKKTNFKLNVLFKVPSVNITLEFQVTHPTVQSVIVSPYYNLGFKFTILGIGFSSSTHYDQSAWVDSFECVSMSGSVNILDCIVYQPQLAEKTYTITIFNNQTGLTGTYKYKFERIYPYISSIVPPKKTGGVVSLYGDYGPKHQVVSLKIAGNDCPILSIDSYLITCIIGSGSGVNSVYLTVDGATWEGINSFKYLEDLPECPTSDSLKVCGGNGICSEGSCFCFDGFVGNSCSFLKPVNKELIIKKNDTLTEIINNGYSFGFSITDIKEIDFSGQLVRQYNFTHWDLTDDSTLEKWTYINKYGNAEISYTIEQVFNTSKNFSFAGETITVQPGSLKLTASINNWEYLGSLNTLQLQIKSSVNAQGGENNDCKNQQQSSIKANSGDGISINYITIEKDNNIFSGRFIDKVESDGRPTYSKVTLSEKTKDSVTVTLSLPYCKICKIDPDFSVMISPSFSSKCDADSSSRLKWVIPVSVVLGLLGLFGIFSLFFFLLRGRIYVSRKAGIILLKKSKNQLNLKV